MPQRRHGRGTSRATGCRTSWDLVREALRVAYRIVFFVALLATAIALGGVLAHVLELPNKISLPADQYFVVQKSYRGWNRLAYVLVIQVIALLTLAIMSR